MLGLSILGVINKCDLSSADPLSVWEEIEYLTKIPFEAFIY